MRVQNRIADIQTNSQNPAIQIKFTTRANPTHLFTVYIKFGDDSCTQKIEVNATNKKNEQKSPKDFFRPSQLEPGAQKILASY